MKELSEAQQNIYDSIFNPGMRVTRRKNHLRELLKEKMMAAFNHDIFDYFLIPSKFYFGENICYYLQNIVLYAAYMEFIAENKAFRFSYTFHYNLAELCIECIRSFFRDRTEAFDDNFCEHLKQTIILSFKEHIADEGRLRKVILNQFYLLSYQTLMKVDDPASALTQHFKDRECSRQEIERKILSNIYDMLSSQPEKEFCEDLLSRCEKMLATYGMILSTNSKKYMYSVQRSQESAVQNRVNPFSSYTRILFFLVLFTFLGWLYTLISIANKDENSPSYLMGSFVLTLVSWMYNRYNDEPSLKWDRGQYQQALKGFEDQFYNCVKITSIDYSVKSPYPKSATAPFQASLPSLPMSIYTFDKLPESIPEPSNTQIHSRTVLKKNDEEKKGRAEKAGKTLFFCAAKSEEKAAELSIEDLQDVLPDMELCRVVNVQNLFLLYDPTESYRSNWILPMLQNPKLAPTKAGSGLVKVRGDLNITGSNKTIPVYELKSFHQGKKIERLLIPLLSILKKDNTEVSILDCRSALFLKDGLHLKGIQQYRFDPEAKKIICASNVSARSSELNDNPKPLRRQFL